MCFFYPLPSHLSRLCPTSGSIPPESGWIINVHILFFTDGKIIWDGFFLTSNGIVTCLRCQYYFLTSLQQREALIRIPDTVTLLLWPWARDLTQHASLHIHWYNSTNLPADRRGYTGHRTATHVTIKKKLILAAVETCSMSPDWSKNYQLFTSNNLSSLLTRQWKAEQWRLFH